MRAWGLTDRGVVRKDNQDCCLVKSLDTAILAVVCDGMGGHNAGDVASNMAMNVFSEVVTDGFSSCSTPSRLDELMLHAATLANRAVFEESLDSPAFRGMGTTLVAAVVDRGQATIANVGDSRAYLLSEVQAVQITNDHSLVAEMVQRGDLTEEEAERFPGRNMITRAVGTEDTVSTDLFHIELREGEFLLLCSDGLSNLVRPVEMQFEAVHGLEPETCCSRLVQIALERGAPDNVTVVLLAEE